MLTAIFIIVQGSILLTLSTFQNLFPGTGLEAWICTSNLLITASIILVLPSIDRFALKSTSNCASILH